MYRLVNGVRAPWVGPKVFWLETYATAKRDTDAPNEMWRNRVFGQIEKCAEAAALRAAFPEEIGGDYIPEEVERGERPVLNVQARPTRSETIATTLGASREASATGDATHRDEQQTEIVSSAADETEAVPLIERYRQMIAAADIDALPNIRGDIATDDGLSAAEKTTLEVEIKARQDALKKK